MNQTARVRRRTGETQIEMSLELRIGESRIDSGLPFLDHMLQALCTHGEMAMLLDARGDIEVDPHHLVEDCGIVFGEALRQALADEQGRCYRGILRCGCFGFPMDASLASVTIDLCGRSSFNWHVALRGEPLGSLYSLTLREFFSGLCEGARATLHVDLVRSDGDHHALEAIFKGLGRSLLVARESRAGIASTKGVLNG